MKDIIIKLQKALGDCKRKGTSKCTFLTSYETILSKFFFILDDKDNEPEEPVKVVGDKDNYQLRVQNNDKKEICLIKTDNCLFGDDHQKCDCILLSKNQIFFVEISESGQRNSKRNKAVDQLSTTIEIFIDNKVDLSHFESKAIICFKNGKTKPIQASFNSQRVIFKSKYKVELEEGNFISF